MPSFFRFLLLFTLSAGLGFAEDMPGLKVGDSAPGFTLTSGSGEEVSLEVLREKGPVVLVFVRSADWCPYCRRQLQDLEANRTTIESTGAQLVAISYDDATTQAQAVAKLELTYPLLADSESRTIDAYGIRNPEAGGKARGVPHPAIFLIDTAGTIRAKLMEADYRDRPSNAVLQTAIESL